MRYIVVYSFVVTPISVDCCINIRYPLLSTGVSEN